MVALSTRCASSGGAVAWPGAPRFSWTGRSRVFVLVSALCWCACTFFCGICFPGCCE
eukprot:JP445879.1.p3 GENE.JP445879.1~~JP445879.1.p3  ORF type:complete len:57 (+),score=1.38 JP445879.1:3-173(+)